MKVTITSLELKSISKLIIFISTIKKIDQQLKNTNCIAYKKSGFWKKYYTMTLWQNEEDMRTFTRSGAHLQAMKISQSMAKKIETLTFEANELPSWKYAKKVLSEQKI